MRNFVSKMILINVAALCLLFAQLGQASTFSEKPEVINFINGMVKDHHFKKQELIALFNQVSINEQILQSMSHPYEAQPWSKYRNIFINDAKIAQGVAFWNEHEEDLLRAEEEYGVPPNIIIAILGVETNYGQTQGTFKVLDALSTLAFNYPPRSKFFKSELEQFLLLTREQHIDATDVYGSYAGAIGQAQFMPSSYRYYAVDFTGTGDIDLRNNTADAIGSIANYFKKNGWKAGEPIASSTTVDGKLSSNVPISKKPRKPANSVKTLANRGLKPDAEVADNTLAYVIELDNEHDKEYWLGFHNFYVITRYNPSNNYAMAVYQLAEEIYKSRANSI